MERQGYDMDADKKRLEVIKAGEMLGFCEARIARIESLDREAFYEQWLAEGRAGDMRFLLHHKKARLDPRSRYPWARSMVSAFFPYAAPAPPADMNWQEELRGRIATYALGPDYHDVMAAKLERWTASIRATLPGTRVKAFVDTGAVFEHEWAARAGVGWTGKHTLTLSEKHGSYAFLGELLLEAELPPDSPVPERCGSCQRCIEICPTGAIEDGFRLDPRKCISYLTIEHRGVIEPELRAKLGPWVFGGDLCQMACPWNDETPSARDHELTPALPDLVSLTPEEFDSRYGASALRRTGRTGLARNAAIVLGNTGNPRAIEPLARAALHHDAALVRGHAVAALASLAANAPSAARAALDHARRDPDPFVRSEANRALERTTRR